MTRYTRQEILTAWPELQAALDEEQDRQRKRAEALAQAKERMSEPDAEHNRRYALAAFVSECDKVAQARETGRNNTLNKAAFALGQLIAAGALDRAEVEDALEAAADVCGLKGHEVDSTIRSGIDAGMENPRVIPEPKKGIRANIKVSNGKKGDEPEGIPPPSDLLTEYGNAWRIYKALKGRIAYSPGLGWLIYVTERGVWEIEPGTERLRRIVTEALREVLEAELGELLAALSEVKKKLKGKHSATQKEALEQEKGKLDAIIRKLDSWINSCENHYRINNTLKQAEGVFWVSAESWDANPDILVCTNGVLNLQTGDLKPHSPFYRATKSTGAPYIRGAKHPAFDKLLDLLRQEGDRYESIRRGSGALLHSGNPNEKLWILEGDAATGKGTLIAAFAAALGDYAQALDVSALLETDRRQGKAAPRPDLMKLRGARFVYSAQEPPKYSKLDAGIVKSLSGNDAISARGMYAKTEVTFYPQFKVWIHTNFAIRVDWDDPGFMRRLVIWPFSVKPDKPDASVKSDLMTDSSAKAAVLAWLVEQYREWRKDDFNLGESDAVSEATRKYWQEINPFSDFSADFLLFSAHFRTKKKAIRDAYIAWCVQNDRKPFSDRELTKWLKTQNVTEQKSGSTRYWLGVGLVDDRESSSPPGGGVRMKGWDKRDKRDTLAEKAPRDFEGVKDRENFTANGVLLSQVSQIAQDELDEDGGQKEQHAPAKGAL